MRKKVKEKPEFIKANNPPPSINVRKALANPSSLSGQNGYEIDDNKMDEVKDPDRSSSLKK